MILPLKITPGRFGHKKDSVYGVSDKHVNPQVMKKSFYVLIIFCLLAGGCATSRQKGMQAAVTRAYLQFINPEGDYPDGVEVYIDRNPSYIAMVTADKDHSTTKDRWPVHAGKVLLKVVYEGSVVYKDSVTLQPGETKQILLPKHNY